MEISINQIKKKYRKTEVLTGVDLSAQSGMMIGIMGGNGCGKSTLLSILAGTVNADSGSFLCKEGNGKAADLLKDRARSARLVGYVPQSTPLLEELTALDNLSLWYTGGRRVLEQELEEGILRDLRISGFLHKKVHSLSGGMKKRLSIGCALAHHPSILLLDEPGAALDLNAKELIVSYLHSFCEKGGIALIASHERTEIEACRKTYILKGGKLSPYFFDGNMERLASSMNEEPVS